jgi:hypothetical protein
MAKIHAPISSAYWEPLTELERQRGAKLLHELAARMERETARGHSMEDALVHTLAHVAYDIYCEPSRDARSMLLYAMMQQPVRIHQARGCACLRGDDCDLDDDHEK